MILFCRKYHSLVNEEVLVIESCTNSSPQFRPVLPTQQGQSFIPAASQQFRPVGQAISSNVGMPAIPSQSVQFSQPMQQFPPRPGQPVHPVPSSQGVGSPYVQSNRPLTAGSPQPQQNAMPGLGAPGMPFSTSYTVRSHILYWIYYLIPFGFLLMVCIVSVCTVLLWPASQSCKCTIPFSTNTPNACACSWTTLGFISK